MPAVEDLKILAEIPLFAGLGKEDLTALNNLLHRKNFTSAPTSSPWHSPESSSTYCWTAL